MINICPRVQCKYFISSPRRDRAFYVRASPKTEPGQAGSRPKSFRYSVCRRRHQKAKEEDKKLFKTRSRSLLSFVIFNGNLSSAEAKL